MHAPNEIAVQTERERARDRLFRIRRMLEQIWSLSFNSPAYLSLSLSLCVQLRQAAAFHVCECVCVHMYTHTHNTHTHTHIYITYVYVYIYISYDQLRRSMIRTVSLDESLVCDQVAEQLSQEEQLLANQVKC